jgi:hypothetical protein
VKKAIRKGLGRLRGAPAAVLLASAVAGAAPGGPGPDVALERSRGVYEGQLLERQSELASGQSFYMVLDPEKSSLKIMLQGVVLRDYEVLSSELGTPRVLFRRQLIPADWYGRIWRGAEIDPPKELERMEVLVEGAPADSAAAPPIPPTPEEAFPAPDRFFIRYEGGLALELRSVEPPKPAAADSTEGNGAAALVKNVKRKEESLRTRLGRLWTPRIWFGRDTLRVRVTMNLKDVQALYRSLPPDTRLFVLLRPAGAPPAS